MRASASDRFWARVDKADGPDACWIWTGNKTNGYGTIRWEGRTQRAHRVAYMLEVGPITEESLDHLCRNKACVNPKHLEQCSLAENNLRSDCVSGINARKTHCNRGHELTPENIRVNEHGRHCVLCEQETRPERHRRYKGALSVDKINARIEADRDRRRRRTERLETYEAALRRVAELCYSGYWDQGRILADIDHVVCAALNLTRAAPRPEGERCEGCHQRMGECLCAETGR